MIYFIAGAGRSGSTLLDIILGSSEKHFSLGELINFVKNGLIDNEYCSCGKKVTECEFWSKVAKDWARIRELSVEDYKELQWKYLRNKATLRSIWNYWFPSDDYKMLVKDTNSLLDIVSKMVNGKVLVDSSKIPQYLLLLKKTGRQIKIIHLTRSVKNVLRSTKKTLKKDPEKGIEKTIKTQSTTYAFFNWLIDNLLVVLFTLSTERIYIKYEKLISDPVRTIDKIYHLSQEDINRLKNKGPFIPQHVVAGGRIRMKKNIIIGDK